MTALRPEMLAQRLRDLGVLSAQQLAQAQEELISTQERFSEILVRRGLLRDPEMGRRLGPQLGVLPQRVEAPPSGRPVTAVPASLWQAHRLTPLRQDQGTLVVATDDPLSVFALDFFGRRCGCALEAILVREQDLQSLQEAPAVPAMPAAATLTSSASAALPAPIVAAAPAPSTPAAVARAAPPAAAPAAAAATAATGDAPIIQLVDSMLSEAVRLRASDIHIEAGAKTLRVRYRIDGVLHDVSSPPKPLQGSLISRLKIMAGLNIAEKRLPQDGRLQLMVEQRPLDVRVSILPATHGESIVLRLLDRSQPVRGLKEMGMPADQEAQWDELIRRPHGMVLVTGPTGSGKTTTLYGALALLNQPDRKLITVEDPVEYQLPGVNQVLVRAGIGLTFAAGLRAMLRQAPDVIMVGEIRDQETAQIAIQAALTGHLVLSTLHTNDAPSAITRLMDMGIAPFLLASTLQGVLAQRLARRLCPHCRLTQDATPEERVFLGTPEVSQLIHSHGCERCHGSGYLGRVGLFELLTVSDALRHLLVTQPGASAIRAQAMQEGMRGLLEDGRQKIRDGVTTMTEVLRVVAAADG